MVAGQDPMSHVLSSRAIKDRLQQLRGDHAYAYIAKITGVKEQSARRQMQNGNPRFDFLVRICIATHCSPEWLLLGTGVMHRAGAPIDEHAQLLQLTHDLGLALERIARGNHEHSPQPPLAAVIEPKPALRRDGRATNISRESPHDDNPSGRGAAKKARPPHRTPPPH
jgi:hypothetical protein